MGRTYKSGWLLVNETFIVDHEIDELWSDWFTGHFLKTLSGSDKVKNIVFSRIKHDHNPDGISYALQYQAESQNIASVYNDEIINKIRTEMFSKFQGLIASFVTEMEILQ